MTLKPRQDRLREALLERKGNARVIAVELSPWMNGRNAVAALCRCDWNTSAKHFYFAMTTTCMCIAKRLAGANRT